MVKLGLDIMFSRYDPVGFGQHSWGIMIMSVY